MCRISQSLTFVERNSGVVSLVDSGNLAQRPRVTSSGSLDLELVALDVELSLADMTLVQADMFNADKILSGRDVLLDRPLQSVLLPGAPVVVRAGVAAAESSLVDFDLQSPGAYS